MNTLEKKIIANRLLDIICQIAGEDLFAYRGSQWKSIATNDIIDDKIYLVRDSSKKNMPPLLAYWDEKDKEFIDLHASHAYGLIVDEFMEIPE